MLSRVAASVLLVVLLAARAAGAADQKPLLILGDKDYAPLSYLDLGAPAGFDVDVVKAIARVLGRPIRIELVDWQQAQDRVLRGDADALTDLAVSDARLQLYDFAESTVTHEFGLFVRSDLNSVTADAVAGRRIGVTAGGFPRQFLSANSGGTLVLVDNYDAGLSQLQQGSLDAVATDVWTGAYSIQRRGLRNIAFSGPPFAALPASIAVRKGNTALIADINRAIQTLRADGTLDRIQATWRPQEMVFLSRQRVQTYVGFAFAALLITIVGILALWVFTLKRQIRERRRAETAMAEHEQRLELALSAADMGAWRWDFETDLNTRDASFNRMLGLDAVESIHGLDDIFSRIAPEDRAKVRAELDRAIRDRDGYATEYRIIRPDGTIRWLRGRGRAFYSEGGVPRYITGATIDITERRDAEAALRGSEEKFAKAFQASPDCVTITEVNTGRLVEVNDRFEEMTGFTRAEALGRSPVEIGLAPDGFRQSFMPALLQAGRIRDIEYEIVRKDGRRSMLLMSAELMEIEGQQRILTVHRDINERKRAEEALHRSEAKYREMVENANDVVFTVDEAGYCLSMNRVGRDFSGFVSDDPRGVHLTELVVPEQAEIARRQLQRVLAGEEVPVFELVIANKGGTRVTLEANVRPIYEDGVPIGAQGIARDVTLRKELEQQLRQAQKMDAIGRLAAGVAHDFNNLLTVILGNCEVAAPLLKADDPVQNTLRDIRASAQRAAALTGQLLAFSRRQLIQPRVLDVNDTVAEIRRMMTRLLGEHIHVRFLPAEELWHVSADPGQLQQVIVNLSVNARDAMPEGGRLTIETRNVHFETPHVERGARVPAGDYVEVSVADTGIGMAPETLERLFEPFFTTKEAGKGTGLGLATVYGIVKQSGGFVFVDSAPNEGSTFWVLLPRADAPLTATHAEAPREESTAGNETVLLVEDETDVRELIHDYLESQGYTVLSAGTGEEGLALCQDDRIAPALLISDIVMPGMNGRVLSEQLRLSYPQLKVLYVSGYTDDALVLHSPLPQGTHFLQKPFALSTLAGKIRDIVDGQDV